MPRRTVRTTTRIGINTINTVDGPSPESKSVGRMWMSPRTLTACGADSATADATGTAEMYS